MSLVEVRGLTKSFPGKPPVRALRRLDLDVAARSLLAVLGPSGCGKTTLLRAIAGFDRPDGGTITIAGRLVAGPDVEVPPERRRVGIVPQEGALFPHLDVAANVAFGLSREDGRRRRARVAAMLELVGLGGYERRRPHELSGGQQQRVALARALAPAPSVVLLDEPFAALDTSLRSTLRVEVAALLATAGATAVLVTHDRTEALTMAGTVAVMRDGVIVQTGSPRVVYARPVDIDAARFLGEAVVLPGEARGNTVACPLGVLPATGATSGPVSVLLRPEQIVRASDSSAVATVRSVGYHGHDAVVALALGPHELLARWPSTGLPAVGDAVAIEVTGTAVAFPVQDPPM